MENLTLQCTVEHDSLLISGFYCKYDRELSQTPFLASVVSDSLSEIIARPLQSLFGSSGNKFHSSGREGFNKLFSLSQIRF